MASRCPPGVICIENITFIFAFIILICVIYFVKHHNHKIIITESSQQRDVVQSNDRIYGLPAVSNFPSSVLMNPHMAPLRNSHYHPPDSSDIRGIPINVPTQSIDSPFRQIGILTRLNGNTGEIILPLMGRPLYARRDKWNFYTMNDKNNMIKLPIVHKGVNGMNEYGCDNIYDGDTVYVEGYDDTFKVKVYENSVMRYIPI